MCRPGEFYGFACRWKPLSAYLWHCFVLPFPSCYYKSCEYKDSAFVSLPLQNCPLVFASWHRHRLWLGLDDICTNFMPIKVGLLKHARSLSHSHYHCLSRVGCERKEKACPTFPVAVNLGVGRLFWDSHCGWWGWQGKPWDLGAASLCGKRHRIALSVLSVQMRF